MTTPSHFKVCSTCRAPIPFGGIYYKCSVSTCNKKALALYFCSIPCWDAHVPDARHRDAWAEKETAPLTPEAEVVSASEPPLRRKVVAPSGAPDAGESPARRTDLPSDVLIVMSKLKGYVKAHSDLRTSDGVSDPLSDHLRDLCDKAIVSAKRNSRTTVLARDIEAAIQDEIASE